MIKMLYIACVLMLLSTTVSGSSNTLKEGDTGIANKYPEDIEIGTDPNVLFASGFEQGFVGWTQHPGTSEIVADAHSGAAAAETTATRGKNTGGDIVYRLPEGQEKLYVRFYCKIAEDSVMPHHFVKVRAMKPGYRIGGAAGKVPAGDEAFWTGIEPRGDHTWHFYTYWHKMHSWQTPHGAPDGRPNAFYGNTFYPDKQTPFTKGKWICVEAMLKCNTLGKSDGEQAFWIDGKLIGHWREGSPTGTWIRDKFVTHGEWNKHPAPFEGFDFRSSEHVLVREIALQWYVSEKRAEKGESNRNSCVFDDVVIATDYIGPLKSLSLLH